MLAAAKEEFELLRSIEHPNIVRALDFLTLPGRVLLVLELFDGRDLKATVDALPQRRMPEQMARPLCTSLLEAVGHLHERRILHRDIKPQNVLVSKGLEDLRLIDFNVAHRLQSNEALTPAGTRLYAAPEVLLGDSACELSDVWAVGLCAHFMLSGRLPQGREKCWASISALQASAAQAVDIAGPRWSQVSEQCKASLRRCLAVERAHRWPAPLLLAAGWFEGESRDGLREEASGHSIGLCRPSSQGDTRDAAPDSAGCQAVLGKDFSGRVRADSESTCSDSDLSVGGWPHSSTCCTWVSLA